MITNEILISDSVKWPGMLIGLVILLLLFFLLAQSANAVCPVCTIAVVGGLGLSRWLKIDDTVSGVWIGGLIVSLGLWTADWLRKRKITIKGLPLITTAAYALVVLVPMYRAELIGHPMNKLWGLDKLILGSFTGIAIFAASVFLDKWLRKQNGGKVFFPYQKVAVPVALLAVGSMAFYLITK